MWCGMISRYPITPIGKPRMTRRDTWKKRPCVLRYYAFKDLIRLYRVDVPMSGATIRFELPMPPSWSKKKREAMNGQPHQQKPDIDNMLKALLDAVYHDDSVVWHLAGLEKRWAVEGAIMVEVRR